MQVINPVKWIVKSNFLITEFVVFAKSMTRGWTSLHIAEYIALYHVVRACARNVLT